MQGVSWLTQHGLTAAPTMTAGPFVRPVTAVSKSAAIAGKGRKMDCEAIDKDMSSYVVTCRKLTTRIFLTDDGLGTDILSRASRYRYLDQAENTAKAARTEYAWKGFNWQPMSVPEALNSRWIAEELEAKVRMDVEDEYEGTDV